MKTYIRFCLIILFGVLLSGCFSPPFKEPSKTKLNSFDPRAIRENFKDKLSGDFEIQHSLTFRIRGRSLSSIGLTKVNSAKRIFNAAAFNPAGLRLFELSYRNGNVDCKFIREKLRQKGNLCDRVAKDIKHIFFDRIPPRTSTVKRKKYIFVFVSEKKSGSIEYRFKGSPPLLVEKRLTKNGSAVWKAAYYEYELREGKLFPGGVVFTHNKHNYRLVLDIKKFTNEQSKKGT